MIALSPGQTRPSGGRLNNWGTGGSATTMISVNGQLPQGTEATNETW
jgi:hypothetical protein